MRRRKRDNVRTEVPTAASVEGDVGSARTRLVALLIILVVGAGLRLVWFGTSPPGLNQDESAEAWNAWTILHTGKDQTGRSWPVLYSRCHGSNRSTLFMYILMPFEMVMGLSPLVNRAPSPILGVLTILVVYGVGRRLFGPWTGLVAASILALNPWHIQLSRWGHQVILCPLLAAAGVWALHWMGLGLNGREARPSVVRASVAGVIWGLATWAYPSSRIFAVMCFAGIVVVTWRAWWEYARARRGALALGCLVGAGLCFLGPMAYYHIRHPEIMSVRLEHSAVFAPDDPVATKMGKALERYPGHFGIDFLFHKGDHYVIQSPPGVGQFHWYMLPAMVIGLIVVVVGARSSRASRVLLMWLLAYPLGDCVSQHVSMHALRSSPGLCGLVLLGSVGAVSAFRWLWRREYRIAVMVSVVGAVAAIGLNARFWHTFFGEYNELPRVYHLGYHVDLLEACDWLKPRLDDYEAVLCTTQAMNLPYSVALVGLSYEPGRWFAGPREVRTQGQWDVYTRFGRVFFLYGPERRGEPTSWQTELRRLKGNNKPDRVLFIIRPTKGRPPGKLVHQVIGPEGAPVLMLYEATL